jgi:sulfur-oxidizing protein SoxZ
MSTPTPRVQVPRTAAKGEIIQIKTLIEHQMETGLRRDSNGEVIPRKIINQFVCRYNDEVVFSVDVNEAVAANPYFEFYLRATTSGRLDFVWKEDGGRVFALRHDLLVG